MTDSEILELILQKRPLIDVRAPIEFDHGSIPGATNLFLLNDDERAAVGTLYKNKGADAAIAHGYEIMSGQTRTERIATWVKFARAHPSTVIYCFRGGMRSQSVQKALRDEGIDLPLIPGGYKRVRTLMIEIIERTSRESEFRVLSGFTGSGKTELLRAVSNNVRVCDLEGLSNHKGSAFGSNFRSLQPSQSDFENRLAVEFSKGEGPIYLEDESRMIGRSVLPVALFDRIISSPVYLIERSITERAEFLTASYLADNFDLIEGSKDEVTIRAAGEQMKESLRRIEKRLGGAELTRLTAMVEDAIAENVRTGSLKSHHSWVERLLELYYDPMYAYHLKRVLDRVVFKGSWEEVREKISRP